MLLDPTGSWGCSMPACCVDPGSTWRSQCCLAQVPAIHSNESSIKPAIELLHTFRHSLCIWFPLCGETLALHMLLV